MFFFNITYLFLLSQENIQILKQFIYEDYTQQWHYDQSSAILENATNR